MGLEGLAVRSKTATEHLSAFYSSGLTGRIEPRAGSQEKRAMKTWPTNPVGGE